MLTRQICGTVPPPATRVVILTTFDLDEYAEIAERLHISPATTRTHIGHLLTKLQARDRAQLVIAAYEAGLISPRLCHHS